jgi:hypothetical protein
MTYTTGVPDSGSMSSTLHSYILYPVRASLVYVHAPTLTVLNLSLAREILAF